MNINKKYAIRKLTVGIASVSIGLFVCNSVNIENPVSTKSYNIVKAAEETNWQPQGNIVAQGVEGVAWELYENGYLLFKPHNGSTTMSRNPIESSWAKYAEQIKAIGFSETIQAPVNSEGLFSGLNNVEYIETEKLDVSNVVNMEAMFYNNSLKNESKIKKLNVSNWNVSNVVNMNRTFMGLNNLKSLDVDNWNTSKVKDMYAVFQGLHELNELKMSNFDTSSITSEYNSSNMFVGLRKLLKIKLGDKLANGTLYNKVFLSLVPSRISVGDIFLPDVYTERWVKEDGTVGPYTYEELYTEYKKNPQKMTGTWVREKKITSYTINFTNSSETINNISVEKNTPATLPTPTVDKTGYKFLGWSKTQDGEVITNTTNIANPGETITLYAKWEKVNNITTERVPIEPTRVYQGDNSIDQGTRNEEQGQPGLKEVITTYQITPITGELTNPTTSENIITPMKPKFKENGAKDKVVVERIPSPVKYEKDDSREKGQKDITTQGRDGSKTTTTTYTVNPETGEVEAHPQEPVVVEPTNTIIKVALKDKVVYSKDGDNIVKETTTYEINPETGKITENTTRGIYKENGAKDKVVVEKIPTSTRYEKDTSREKGQENIITQGKDGSKTIRTTYTVNPETGEVEPHPQEPVIVEATNTIVKVAAKDKVIYLEEGDTIVKEIITYEVNPETGNITENKRKEKTNERKPEDKIIVEKIPTPIKYEKDTSREKGQENITVQGKDGTKTTTTTYTINPETGEVISHTEEPIIVESTSTIIKVAAKDKVEIVDKKDGSVVKEITTYEVNPNTGEITESKKEEVIKNKIEHSKGESEILESSKEFSGGTNSTDAPIVEELPELKVAVIKDNKGNILDVVKENEKSKEIKGYKNTGKTEIDKDGYKVYIYEKIETQKPITKEKQLDTSNKEDNLKDNKETINKKEELPKTSSSMLSTVGLLSIFGLRKNRKKNK